MKFQPLFSLSVSLVICSGALTAGGRAQIAERPHAFKISEPPVFELPPSPWDTVSPYQDGLPSLPPGHDTTLLSGSGVPQDKARIFEHLKNLTKLDKDPADLYHGFGKSFSVIPSDEDWKVVTVEEPQEYPWNTKGKYNDPAGPPSPRKPDAHPDRPGPEHGEGKGKPEDLQRRLHQLEKELEASRRREAALRVVVKDLIEQMPPLLPAITSTQLHPQFSASATVGASQPLYLQGYLALVDGLMLELRKDFVGAYRNFKRASELFETATESAPPDAQSDLNKFRQKLPEHMERVRQAEFQRRQNKGSIFRQKGQDGLKKQSGKPGSPAESPHAPPEGPPPPPPPPHDAPQDH